MSQTVWVNLEQAGVAELLDRKCRAGGEETSIVDFLNCLTDRENKSTIGERKNDVGIVFIWD